MSIMLVLNVSHQESYSRLELLLRSLFGALYISIPHVFILFFLLIWSKLLWFYSVFHVLLIGKMPKNLRDFQVGLLRWSARLHCSVYNLVDGYPKFGIRTVTKNVELNIEFNETPSRLITLLRFTLLPLVVLPHLFVWMFRNLVSSFLTFLAFWVVLFTGKYPVSWHEFNVGTLRWVLRVYAYMYLLEDNYPPFSGKQMQ